jgi:N-ethylmaleimide reductase
MATPHLPHGHGDARLRLGREVHIAGPDPVERLRAGPPVAPADEATSYQGGDAGHPTFPACAHTA